MNRIVFIINILQFLILQAWGHGRLMDPPSRSSMWRVGYNTYKNYNDNEVYCGGVQMRWSQSEGMCGVCGDKYSDPKPRNYEAGGKYAKNIHIVKHYDQNKIRVSVDLTSNHLGYFEFRLCSNNNSMADVEQECFDRYPLKVFGTDQVRYEIGSKTGTFKYDLEIPPGITCSACILQWNYFTGNTWGTCRGGDQKVGCGLQKLWRNCADISINSPGVQVPYQENEFPEEEPDNRKPIEHRPETESVDAPQKQIYQPVMNNKPQVLAPSVMLVPDSVPIRLVNKPIRSTPKCVGIGDLAGALGADDYCQLQCIGHTYRCPTNQCKCYY